MAERRGPICVRLALLALLTLAPGAGAQETFTLELGDRRAEIPTRRIGAQRFVALDDLARGFSGRLEWLDVGDRAAATILGERVVFRRDLPFVEARGSLHQIPHAPRFVDGELYIPFSFIQQGLPAIFPERFDFEPESSSLRGGPPGRPSSIEYLVAPGLTTLRFFFARQPPRVSADASLPHALVLRVEGGSPPRGTAAAVRALGLVDSLSVAEEESGSARLTFHLADEAFLYQVARLEEPAGFEVTIYAPASGVDEGVVLARSTAPPAGATAAPPRSLAADPAAVGMEGDRPPRSTAPPEPTEVAAAPPVPEASPVPPSRPRPRGERARPRAGVRTIVIDAGHGGRDTGAIGPRGLREKDVTLAIARGLAAELARRSDLRVILTRDDDVFVPLSRRTRMANEAGADLFVSIHCNAARSRSGGGFETYFLSEAKTEDERRVAAMENASLRFENPEIDPEELGELNFILWDLAQNEYLRESSSLAAMVQEGIADELDLRDRGVKQAGFWVLNGAYMPAILVETAFISNPREERLLGSQEFRERLVDGLADSLMEYVDIYERKVAEVET